MEGQPFDNRTGIAPQAGGEPQHSDEVLTRLHAADPAAGARPDMGFVHAAVGATTGLTLSGHAPVAQVGELAAVAVRRRPQRWIQVAAAVAGIAVVGTAGYLTGAHRAQPHPAALAPITLTADAGEGTAQAPLAGDTLGRATAGSLAAGWWGGRTVFSAHDLPAAGSAGTGWAFDAASVANAQTASRLAAVLGVTGDVRQEWGAYAVGAADGTGPFVSLNPDGTASFSYYDPTRDPWACEVPAVEPAPADEDAAVSSGGSSGEAVCPQTAQTAPSVDAATLTLQDAMTALGVDFTGWEFDGSSDTGSTSAQVSAYQVLAGQRTGLQWSATVVGDGLQSLNGFMAPVVDLGVYDTVSPTQAVERLSDPRFGVSGSAVMPMAEYAGAAAGQDTTASDDAVAVAQAPVTPAAGAAIAWPVREVSIVSARLGVALTYQADGAALLAPAYELTDGDGGVWAVIAVADAQLNFAD